jgi:dephospho-CoA kinase
VTGAEFIFGLTGTIASGKESVAAALQQHGFQLFSLSDEVREEARRRVQAGSRASLQDIGNDLRSAEGADVLARRTLDRIQACGVTRVVVDGIRNPSEAEYFRLRTKFTLIGVEASREIRFARLKERARQGDPLTWEEFVAADGRDRGLGEDSAGQQVDACLKRADIHIRNDGSVDELHRKVDRILREFGAN